MGYSAARALGFSIFTLPGSTRQTPNNVFSDSVALTPGLSALLLNLDRGTD